MPLPTGNGLPPLPPPRPGRFLLPSQLAKAKEEEAMLAAVVAARRAVQQALGTAPAAPPPAPPSPAGAPPAPTPAPAPTVPPPSASPAATVPPSLPPGPAVPPPAPAAAAPPALPAPLAAPPREGLPQPMASGGVVAAMPAAMPMGVPAPDGGTMPAGPDTRIMQALGVIPWWEIVRLALAGANDPRAALVSGLLDAQPAVTAMPAEPTQQAGVPQAFLDWLAQPPADGAAGPGDEGLAGSLRAAYQNNPDLAPQLYEAVRALADEAPDLLPPDLQRALGGGTPARPALPETPPPPVTRQRRGTARGGPRGAR